MRHNKTRWISGLILAIVACGVASGCPQQDTAKETTSGQASNVFRTAAEYIASLQLPSGWDVYTDEGDLNGDGLADVVILATGRKKCMTSEIHVLLRTPHNTLVPVASDNLGCNSSLEVQTSTEVKSGNLFVTMAAWKGADTTYQFHWNNRFFELIGMRTHVVSGGLDDEPIFTADTDFNLRTGTALFKRRVYADRSPGELPPPADRRPTRVHAQGPKCALDKLTFEPLFCANDWKAGDTTVGDLMLIK